jgi:hypothetical protein
METMTPKEPAMADQMELPFAVDEASLSVFLSRWCEIEDQEDALREQKRVLREDYKDTLPLRGVLTAVKIVRARRKLDAHPKEPMPPAHLAILEELLEDRLGVQDAVDAMIEFSKDTGLDLRLSAGEEQ